MAIILQKLTTCQKFNFSENEGIIVEHAIGKMYQGTVILQALDDRDSFRITLADIGNAGKALLKDFYSGLKYALDPTKISRVFNVAKRMVADDLCHFDFTKAEIASGKKLMKMQERSVNGQPLYMLLCYDFSTYEGRTYFFDEYNEVKTWAEALDITEYEIADLETGKVFDIETF